MNNYTAHRLTNTDKTIEVTFQVEGDRVAVICTAFGASIGADRGKYNAERVSVLSVEDARACYRHYKGLGFAA